MKLLLSIIILLCYYITNINGNNNILYNIKNNDLSALEAQLSTNGLEYIAKTFFPIILQKLEGLQIPEQKGEKDGFDYELKDISLSGLSFSNVDITLNNGFDINLSGLSGKLDASWKFKLHDWPHVPDGSGDVDVDISDSSISISMSVFSTPDGHPQLDVTSCSVKFNKLDIHVHGSAWDWLIDLLKWLFNGVIKSEASKIVSKEATSIINSKVDEILAKVPMYIPVSKEMEMDLHLTGNPIFYDNSISFYIRGAIVETTNTTLPPGIRTVLPQDEPINMIGLYIDEYVLNSLFYDISKLNMINITVNDSMIPPSVPLRLNTSNFQDAVPALYKAFPNDLFELHISDNKPFIAKMSTTGTELLAYINMDWLCLSNGEYKDAFTTSLLFDFNIVLNINDTTSDIYGKLALNKITTTLTKSAIGTFSTDMLNSFFNGIIGGPIVSLINIELAKGIPLPNIGGFQLIEPTINTESGFVHLATDLKYVPPQ